MKRFNNGVRKTVTIRKTTTLPTVAAANKRRHRQTAQQKIISRKILFTTSVIAEISACSLTIMYMQNHMKSSKFHDSWIDPYLQYLATKLDILAVY